MDLIAQLPQTTCKILGIQNQRNTIYTSRLTIGKHKFICTLNILNPEAANVSAFGNKEGINYLIKGTYVFTMGTSASGLPKLTAAQTKLLPNAVFVDYSVPRNDPRLRWAKLDEEILHIGKGIIINNLDEYPAKFVGVLPVNAQIKLKNSTNEILKVLTVRYGGAYEEV